MRILQIVPTYLPAVRHGGPIRAVHGLARALVDRGHEVSVFTTNLHGRESLEVPVDRPVDVDGVAVRYFAASWPRRMARSRALSLELARAIGRFDVAHLHSLFLWPTFAGARAAERGGLPYVVSPRGMLVRDLLIRRGRLRKNLWIRLVERRTLSRAARIVMTSDLEADEARAFEFALPPVEIVPNGVDSEVARAAPASREALAEFDGAGPLFVFLGRLSWKKGIEALIECLVNVENVRVAIAGNDDEGIASRLREMAVERGVADRVLFPGFVDGSRRIALIDSARALVLPSISENFGNVIVEAWSRAVPVVVTRGVGLATATEAAGAGIVSDPEPEALAAVLANLACNADAARAMGECGRALVRERFSWPTISIQVERIYSRVITERSGVAT